MDEQERKLRRRRALVRLLSFPVCTTIGTGSGFVLGKIAGRGVDSIFPLQITYALVGLVIGIIVAAVIGTIIDIKNLRE